MRKLILLFALLLSAMNMMAQAYEFEIKESTSNNKGKKFFYCEMNDYTKLSASSPEIKLALFDYYDKNITPKVGFHFYKDAIVQYKSSFAIVKNIRKLALSIPKDNIGKKKGLTINMYLSNGDVLHGTNRGNIYIDHNQRFATELYDSVGMVSGFVDISCLRSSTIPKEIQTTENQQVICQQLRTYDIVKIEVDGVGFDVRGLRSAATFDAMFNALAQKTGKGHLFYRYNSSSSSSNVSSGPSASCKLDFVLTLEKGVIICKMDDLIISGTRGKDYEVKAIFENTELDCIPHEFYWRSRLSPEIREHDNVRIKGHVDDLDYMMWNNRGRFKVHIEITIGNQIVYESNSKYITFYRDGEKWRCVRHN